MMKIITVIGARPQFVKAATISRAIIVHNQENPDQKIIEIIVHTGQHYDANMSDIFFEEMQIPKPGYTLGVGSGTHGAMTGRQLEKIEEVLLKEKPDFLLVYGDTNSTLAGALAAAKLHIPVIHIESGLRSFNMKMPEEVNRILTDNMSSILFCPSDAAVQNLTNEGFQNRDCEIVNVGDVMYDAALFYENKNVKPSKLKTPKRNFALVTIHRADNTDDLKRLNEIISALNELSEEMDVICPIHPRTRKIIEDQNIEFKGTLLDPVGYFEMIWLLKNCSLVLTDSGGLQKEAYFFNTACITMRDQTEWVELVDAGVNILVGANKEKILSAVEYFKDNEINTEKKIYGEGDASFQIIRKLNNE